MLTCNTARELMLDFSMAGVLPLFPTPLVFIETGAAMPASN